MSDAKDHAIRVLSSNGVGAVLRALGPSFERATGYRLDIRYEPTAVLERAIDKGAPFDLAILTEAAIGGLEARGSITAGSRTALARSGVGVAVRAGAPRPDIATADALRRALLAASSVAYTTHGASGIHFTAVLRRLGIDAAVSAKARLTTGGLTATLVVNGEAELAVQQISELLAVPGIALVGPFPPDLQLHTLFVIGIGARARVPAAAASLARFLTAPEALPVITTAGMELPVT